MFSSQSCSIVLAASAPSDSFVQFSVLETLPREAYTMKISVNCISITGGVSLYKSFSVGECVFPNTVIRCAIFLFRFLCEVSKLSHHVV